MSLLFLARPSFNFTEPESDNAARNAVPDDSSIVVHTYQSMQSMTANNFNNCLAKCLNLGGYDYFAMLHADVTAERGWAQTLVEQMELHDFDVIHAPVPYKNDTGKSSTGVAYGDSIGAPIRKIMMAELQDLPQTFGVDCLRDTFDKNVKRLLPNTGCMVWRLDGWVDNFPGFTMIDQFSKQDGQWVARTMSEDYVFGHWCADYAVYVGATKVRTGHVGRKIYWSDEVWGAETDEQYAREAAVA